MFSLVSRNPLEWAVSVTFSSGFWPSLTGLTGLLGRLIPSDLAALCLGSIELFTKDL